jgi:alpha-galactosidase
MPRIAIIGAGSGFGLRLSTDIMAYEELRDSTLVLMDINEENLERSGGHIKKVAEAHDVPTRIECTTDRREALDGADFVVVAISVGGAAYSGSPYYEEMMIPLSYGVSQQIGDTVGPAGVLRALRTAPVMLGLCRDMEELCPDALMINYTNPMSMLCWIMTAASSIDVIGLCHSVQGTARQLAGYIDVPPEEVSYWCAGINHMSWYLEYCHNGEDAYPALREAMDNPEIYAKDTVRFEIMRHFDYFVTESTRHMSEYVPYFRKRPELLEEFGLDSRKPPKVTGDDRRSQRWEWADEKLQKQLRGEEPMELKPSHEYASHIMRAMETGEPFRMNGNVPNDGIISNLPNGCCVEVPCLVDNTGIHGCTVGELPPQLAALNLSNIAVHELATLAVLERDLRKAYQAVLVDPLTAAVCSAAEIRKMFDEMVEAEGDLLDYYK